MKNDAKVRFAKDIQGTRDSDNYSTPHLFYERLDNEFKFNFDPCPLKHNFLWDGLDVDWNGNIYCNPPYSNIKPFLEKAINEIKLGRCEIAVFLIPVRSDTKYWHDIIMKECSEIRFIKGRLNFNESKSASPFPCVLLIFRKIKTELSICSY